MNRDTQQAPFRRAIDREIEHRSSLQDAGDYASDPAVVFLQHQKILRSNERHGRRRA